MHGHLNVKLAKKHNNISHYIHSDLYMLNYTPISLMQAGFLSVKLNQYFKAQWLP